VATFSSAAALQDAARRLRGRGIPVHDVHTPYPLHGAEEWLGLRRSRLPVVTLLGGLLGAATAAGMQFYMAVFDWPLNVGGKPPNSTLAFVPITFELTILFAGLLTAAAFVVRSRLKPGLRPVQVAEGTTEDTFALVVRCSSTAAFDESEARRLLIESGAARLEVKEISR
jgi:hypothetical protein